ncbi:(3S,6E)-nerolidol synthase 1-like isoform X2 [Panicum miliaceum]|uniref:(3S,6E)-nerolidol synthase 1-like isoform X2 n=1 Tax=Panicum miliaceum TaxID=4540 RepID=A0A3L6QEE9_PANMI|nr:(3S,6E)-nerolidol synthase 1-like isoform X2 [Panicum miliaceum]
MAAAPAHIFFFTSVRPLLISALPAAGNARRGGGRPLPASKTRSPGDHDLQKSITDVQKTLHGHLKSGREMMAAVDNLKRLCIDHYFEEEVESAVGAAMDLVHSDDLLEATLSFRLLRETGHDVSTDDVLPRFTNGAGEFSLALSNDDIWALLSLHDMSHLNMGEEASLHKAKDFSSKHLASAIRYLNPGLGRYVRQSLDHPYHLSLMQYKARHHLSYLQSLPNRKSTAAMEELATAEFHLNKLLHQKEMEEVNRWWMGLGLAQEVPVARDQVLKWYMWSMTIIQGSSFSRYRVELTKIISLIYIVDDLFDLVGTQEQLSLFTKAVKIWNTAAADSLPSCMRSCYKALYTITTEIADAAEKEHGMNPVNHLRKAWAELFDGFMVESKWLAAGLVPAAEDYLRNGVVTSGMPLALAHVLFLLGHDHAAYSDAAKLSADHIPRPSLARARSSDFGMTWAVPRSEQNIQLLDDEAQEGLDGSYRDLFLIENPRCAANDAEEHMRRLIVREWEELNREYCRRRTFSSGFMQACLNAARMVRPALLIRD